MTGTLMGKLNAKQSFYKTWFGPNLANVRNLSSGCFCQFEIGQELFTKYKCYYDVSKLFRPETEQLTIVSAMDID